MGQFGSHLLPEVSFSHARRCSQPGCATSWFVRRQRKWHCASSC